MATREYTPAREAAQALLRAIRSNDEARVRGLVAPLEDVCTKELVLFEIADGVKYHRECLTPLEIACRNDTPDMIRLLVSLKPRLRPGILDKMVYAVFEWPSIATLYHDRGPAWDRVLSSRLPMFEALVDMGADINQPMIRRGITPLAHAVLCGFKDLAEYLLEHGAVAGHPPNNQCPYCYAVSRHDNDYEYLRLLLEHGIPRCSEDKCFIRHNNDIRRTCKTTFYQWSPARHYRAPPEMRAAVRTVLALRASVPGLVDIPPEVLFLVFELMPYA